MVRCCKYAYAYNNIFIGNDNVHKYAESHCKMCLTAITLVFPFPFIAT